jgi:ankyrin repeat protein
LKSEDRDRIESNRSHKNQDRIVDTVTADALLEKNALALASANTALHFAADSENLTVAELLMVYGANPTRGSGVLVYSPLHLAARNGDMQLVAYMLERLRLIGLAWATSQAQMRHVGTSVPNQHVSASSSLNLSSAEEESIVANNLEHKCA